MQQKHAKDVAEIEKVTFHEPWSERQILELLEDPKVTARVIEDADGNAVAYYSYTSVCGEGYINNIAVRSDMRGKGLGNALMRDMTYTASLNCLEALTLEVRESNSIARALYEKYGFKAEGIRKKFYENTEDAIIYWLHVGGIGDLKL